MTSSSPGRRAVITEWLIVLGMEIGGFFATLFPEWEIPAWMVEHRTTLVDMLETYNGFGVWVNWPVLGLCVAAVGVAYASGLGVRLARAVAAHVPQFGGAGA